MVLFQYFDFSNKQNAFLAYVDFLYSSIGYSSQLKNKPVYPESSPRAVVVAWSINGALADCPNPTDMDALSTNGALAD